MWFILSDFYCQSLNVEQGARKRFDGLSIILWKLWTLDLALIFSLYGLLFVSYNSWILLIYWYDKENSVNSQMMNKKFYIIEYYITMRTNEPLLKSIWVNVPNKVLSKKKKEIRVCAIYFQLYNIQQWSMVSEVRLPLDLRAIDLREYRTGIWCTGTDFWMG